MDLTETFYFLGTWSNEPMRKSKLMHKIAKEFGVPVTEVSISHALEPKDKQGFPHRGPLDVTRKFGRDE